MNRKSEIEDLVTGFVASMQAVITRWRQVDGVDVLKHFTAAVESERQRYQRKFAALRTSDPDLADVIDDIEAKINNIADSEIARAKVDGKVEFDHLTAALRDTGRGLADAVGQLKESK